MNLDLSGPHEGTPMPGYAVGSQHARYILVAVYTPFPSGHHLGPDSKHAGDTSLSSVDAAPCVVPFSVDASPCVVPSSSSTFKHTLEVTVSEPAYDDQPAPVGLPYVERLTSKAEAPDAVLRIMAYMSATVGDVYRIHSD